MTQKGSGNKTVKISAETPGMAAFAKEAGSSYVIASTICLLRPQQRCCSREVLKVKVKTTSNGDNTIRSDVTLQSLYPDDSKLGSLTKASFLARDGTWARLKKYLESYDVKEVEVVEVVVDGVEANSSSDVAAGGEPNSESDTSSGVGSNDKANPRRGGSEDGPNVEIYVQAACIGVLSALFQQKCPENLWITSGLVTGELHKVDQCIDLLIGKSGKQDQQADGDTAREPARPSEQEKQVEEIPGRLPVKLDPDDLSKWPRIMVPKSQEEKARKDFMTKQGQIVLLGEPVRSKDRKLAADGEIYDIVSKSKDHRLEAVKNYAENCIIGVRQDFADFVEKILYADLTPLNVKRCIVGCWGLVREGTGPHDPSGEEKKPFVWYEDDDLEGRKEEELDARLRDALDLPSEHEAEDKISALCDSLIRVARKEAMVIGGKSWQRALQELVDVKWIVLAAGVPGRAWHDPVFPREQRERSEYLEEDLTAITRCYVCGYSPLRLARRYLPGDGEHIVVVSPALLLSLLTDSNGSKDLGKVLKRIQGNIKRVRDSGSSQNAKWVPCLRSDSEPAWLYQTKFARGETVFKLRQGIVPKDWLRPETREVVSPWSILGQHALVVLQPEANGQANAVRAVLGRASDDGGHKASDDNTDDDDLRDDTGGAPGKSTRGRESPKKSEAEDTFFKGSDKITDAVRDHRFVGIAFGDECYLKKSFIVRALVDHFTKVADLTLCGMRVKPDRPDDTIMNKGIFTYDPDRKLKQVDEEVELKAEDPERWKKEHDKFRRGAEVHINRGPMIVDWHKAKEFLGAEFENHFPEHKRGDKRFRYHTDFLKLFYDAGYATNAYVAEEQVSRFSSFENVPLGEPLLRQEIREILAANGVRVDPNADVHVPIHFLAGAIKEVGKKPAASNEDSEGPMAVGEGCYLLGKIYIEEGCHVGENCFLRDVVLLKGQRDPVEGGTRLEGEIAEMDAQQRMVVWGSAATDESKSDATGK